MELENNNEVKKKKSAADKNSSFLYETVSILVSALVIIAVLFIFFVRFVGVDGDSMNPTLSNGDWLIVSAINTEIEQGDIVISTQPNGFNKPIIKRVIAKGGQTVDIDFEKGVVYVDNQQLDEPYIADATVTMEGIAFPLKVPEGKLFLMGDNRNDSTDSRSPEVGCVDERYVLGVVRYRMMPNFKKFN